MQHTSLALDRPVTTVMVFLALVAVGLISGRLLRLEAMPDITFPGMQVVIPYSGSTPEEMEQLVVRPVEEALATIVVFKYKPKKRYRVKAGHRQQYTRLRIDSISKE